MDTHQKKGVNKEKLGESESRLLLHISFYALFSLSVTNVIL